FGQLTQLEQLCLTNNQLSTLSELFGDFDNLEKLWLDGNQLSSLPESLGNLPMLYSLYLDHNLLSILPKSFRNLDSLETLTLYKNRFFSNPESVQILLQILSKNPSIIRNVQPVLQRVQDKSSLIVAFLIQEGKTLLDVTLLRLFELVKLEEVSPVQVKALRPVLLAILLASPTSSKVRLQARRALKRLGEKEIN
ncbi:MAG: leucine-rich repeat domain-containing protein, partial [Candidatus Hermodarchaeota archaeon]